MANFYKIVRTKTNLLMNKKISTFFYQISLFSSALRKVVLYSSLSVPYNVGGLHRTIKINQHVNNFI